MAMWAPAATQNRALIIAGVIVLTVAIHYGYVLEPIFGQQHWIHAVHGRFCYVPIAIAAAWFGIRGGLAAAAVISALVLPYAWGQELDAHTMAGEMVEILFYFGFAVLVGALVERELRTRQKQQDAQLQLERSHTMSLVGQVAAGVAHEIKNPLTSIKGATDILIDPATDLAERNEFAAILQAEVKRINGTVTEFLEFARPKETLLTRLDFSETIRATVRQMGVVARQSEIELTHTIAPNLYVSGDNEKLHQMTMNLLLNAIQASPTGGTVSLTLSATSPERVQLVITDEGPGVSAQEQERIFEPFYTTKATGTGLGLAVVGTVVDEHHGRIEIGRQQPTGASFTLHFPRMQG